MMTGKMQMRTDMRNRLLILLGVWVLYVLLSFLAPQAESVSRAGLTLTQANLLRFTVLLPLLFIWITALFSAVRFQRYSKFIEGSAESRAFKLMTNGLWMLLLVIVVPSFINIVASYYPESETAQQFSTIIRNYVTVGLYLAGFWYLWQASESLLGTIGVQDIKGRMRSGVLAILGILVIVYTWAIFQNPVRYVSTDPIVKATYYLPDAFIILTIIIPYALAWLCGTLAILNIIEYAKRVQGVIYRQTFLSVAYGLAWTVILLIGLQFLSQINAILSHAALKVILVIIYLLLLAIAAGYLLIARGAQKLTVIEEIK
jgi:hypothetical protein